MNIVVQYFAAARERAGLREERVEVADDATVQVVFEAAVARHPGLESLRSCLRFALDEDFCTPQAQVRNHHRVALLPPVAGG